jgi:hypothetical protein
MVIFPELQLKSGDYLLHILDMPAIEPFYSFVVKIVGCEKFVDHRKVFQYSDIIRINSFASKEVIAIATD